MARRGPTTARRKCNVGLPRRRRRRRSEEEKEEDANRAQARTANGGRDFRENRLSDREGAEEDTENPLLQSLPRPFPPIRLRKKRAI